MRKTDYIDFNRDTYQGKTKKRVIMAVLAAFFCGTVIFVVLLAVNDFSLERFLGMEPSESSQTDESADAEDESPEPAALFSDENAVTVMLLCSDEKSVTFCDLISFSAAENSVKVKPVSTELMMSYGGREKTFGELFADFGASEIASAFDEKNITVNRYISVTEENFRTLIQKLGNVRVYFPNDVDFTVDSIRYQYFTGTREINSDALLSVMKNAFSGDSALSFQAQAIGSIIDSYFTPELFEKDDGIISRWFNLIDGNFSAFDYAEHKNEIISFFSGDPEIIVLS